MTLSKEYPVTFSAQDLDLAVLHHPNSALWILELRGGADSRFTGEMCSKAFLPALTIVEKDWRERWRAAQAADKPVKGAGAGALIIVGRMKQQKFFSNGFEYEEVTSTPGLGFIYSGSYKIHDLDMTTLPLVWDR